MVTSGKTSDFENENWKIEDVKSEQTDPETPLTEIRVYRRRWIFVASLSILIFSNSMSRLAFGPVAYTSALFYEREISVINWFAIIYMVVGIPIGLPAIWVMNKIGLRISLIAASWVNFLGSLFRLLSAIDSVPTDAKLGLVLTGHIFSAASQPFFMFIPTKVASIWFPENQRATANSIMSMCNPLGILAANIFSPLIVQQPSDILLMVVIYAIPAGIGAVMASFGVQSDAPPLPPSLSAEKKSESFWKGIKDLIRNIQYWILVLGIGGGIGIFTAITVFLEQILCPKGYSDIFIGVVCGSCLVLVGVIGAIIAGKIADKTKKFALVAKISYFFTICAVGAFAFVQSRRGLEVVIAILCGLIGFFALPLLPLGNELVVETTYPVESGSSAGLVFLAGQIQGLLLIVILQEVAQPIPGNSTNVTSCVSSSDQMSPAYQNNPITIKDMTVPCYVLFGYSCFVCLCFLLFYRNANKRINVENKSEKRTCTSSPSSKVLSPRNPCFLFCK